MPGEAHLLACDGATGGPHRCTPAQINAPRSGKALDSVKNQGLRRLVLGRNPKNLGRPLLMRLPRCYKCFRVRVRVRRWKTTE